MMAPNLFFENSFQNYLCREFIFEKKKKIPSLCDCFCLHLNDINFHDLIPNLFLFKT